jgi:prepilin-type N-terminal cleavage/methylation domain-containing protein
MKIKNNRKGFTLIELLVVIAIIAVLAVVVILSLNPAELLRQARDSNRVSDMATLKSAISLYLADQTSPNLASSSLTAPYSWVYFSQANPPTLSVATSGFATADFAVGSTTGTSSRAINAQGWIPVNFSAISSGSPLGSLPVDPTNATNSIAQVGGGELIYGYAATSTGTSFKLTAHMESLKFSTNGAGDVETGDGGNSTSTYEQGSNLTL